MVKGKPLKNNALFEYKRLDNKLSVSCYNINKSNIELVIKEINKFNPTNIHAYPSSFSILINEIGIRESALKLKINSIFLGSEYLFELDRLEF